MCYSGMHTSKGSVPFADVQSGGNTSGEKHMNKRRFHGEIARLRAPERLALLETERVVDTCLEGITARNVLVVHSLNTHRIHYTS
jgi:hypothetical protein